MRMTGVIIIVNSPKSVDVRRSEREGFFERTLYVLFSFTEEPDWRRTDVARLPRAG